jgi:hypothetical protein
MTEERHRLASERTGSAWSQQTDLMVLRQTLLTLPQSLSAPTGSVPVQRLSKRHIYCVITGFRRSVNAIFTLLRCTYRRFGSTYRVPSSTVKQSETVEDGTR